MKHLIAILSLTLLCGCGALIPAEHKEQTAVRTSGELSATHEEQLTKRVSTPPVAMRLGGIGNKVEVTLPPGSPYKDEVAVTSREVVQSSGSDSAKGSTASSIPLFVKVIGLGVGVLVLGAAVFWVVKGIRNGAAGAAASAAFDAADTAAAGSIQSIETMLHASNDPAQKQTLLSVLNELNKSRGKVAAQAPAPPPPVS